MKLIDNSFWRILNYFQNTACNSTQESKYGTCYTVDECSDRDGTAAGTCAQGHGVCCLSNLHNYFNIHV